MTIKDAEQLARELIAKHLGTVCCNPLYEEFEECVGEGAEYVMRNEIKKLAPKLKVNPENIFFGYTDGVYNFEIVKKIPHDFFVWNIGECMNSDNLIPLCERKSGGNPYEIELTTLKAIVLSRDEVQLIRKAAGYGINSLAAARKYVTGEYNEECHEVRLSTLAASVIVIYERITED